MYRIPVARAVGAGWAPAFAQIWRQARRRRLATDRDADLDIEMLGHCERMADGAHVDPAHGMRLVAHEVACNDNCAQAAPASKLWLFRLA